MLVVEDDPDIREAIESCLRGESYEVYAAHDGRMALAKLDDGLRPGVILLDLMMPVMNGWETLEALRARPEWRTIPVVIVSASHVVRDSKFDAPVVRVLRKPFQLEPLCAAVRDAIAA